MLIFSWLYATFGEKGRPCMHIVCIICMPFKSRNEKSLLGGGY